MAPVDVRRQLIEKGSRGRIVGLLRLGGRTITEIASALDLTDNAVRVQLAALERDGLVQKGGLQRGVTRPAHVYELAPELEHLLSGAYILLLHQLVLTVAEREAPEEFDALMRESGRRLASVLPLQRANGALEQRVAAASRMMNQELGALTEVEQVDGGFLIRGHGCPLSALTGKHPSICHSVESLLAEVLGTRVRERCDRSGRPRCRFEVMAASQSAGTPTGAAQAS